MYTFDGKEYKDAQDVREAVKAAGKKASVWTATTFAELEAAIAAQEQMAYFQTLADKFTFIQENISYMTENAEEMQDMTAALAGEYAVLVKQPPTTKGFLSNIVERYNKMVGAVAGNISGGVEAKQIKHQDFRVFKDANDEWRWLGVVTNKFQDRDEEILTDAAHKEFCAFLDAHPEHAPVLMLWHTPGTERKNRADFWDYADGFFVYSGVLTDEEAESYKSSDDGTPIGMSHGFYPLQKNGKYISQYRTFEVSELPLENAANPYTLYEIRKEQENRMAEKTFAPQKRAFLASRLGEEKVAQLEGNIASAKEALEQAGVNWKELLAPDIDDAEGAEPQTEQAASEVKEEPEPQADTQAEAQPEAQPEQQAEAKEADATAVVNAEAIVKAVVETMNLEGLQAALASFDDRIKALQPLLAQVAELKDAVAVLRQSDDEKIVKALSPAKPFAWMSATAPAASKEAASAADVEVIENAAKDIAATKAARVPQNQSWMSGFSHQ